MFVRSLFDIFKCRLMRPVNRQMRRSSARRFGAGQLQRLESLEDRRLLTFNLAVNYAAGTAPQAIVSADFNGDNRLDLAVVNYSSNNVSVLLGNAGGTFQLAQNSATGAGPLSLAVGDFNADGKLDLATANAGDVSVLLGNGNGTFGAATSIAVAGSPQSVAVGDFDADGRLDLGVTSNIYYSGGCYYSCYPGYYEGRANVLLGTGTGSFAAPIASFLGNGNHTSAAVADFNGDGKQDFASANYDYGTVDVLLGTGTGTFGAPTGFDAGSYPGSVAAGDVNGDGKFDLVTANLYGNNVSVLLGNGLGSFAAPQYYIAGSQPRSVALADFNGDGKIDLATANGDTGTVSVLLGTGTGSFKPPVNAAAGSYPLGVAVGDFNGDGGPDAASVNSNSNNVSVLLNNGIWPALDAPSITINDVTVTEGNIGTVNATFTVSLSAAYSQPVSIHYGTSDYDATVVGGDYQATSGTLTFNPTGSLTQTVTVLVNGDRLAEYSEFFSIRLTNPTNAFVADATGVGTILDDEPYVSIGGSVSGLEGNTGTKNMTFTVTLSAVYDAPVTVTYATADGSATIAGSDYQAKTDTLTIPAGQTSQTITVLVNGDRIVESDEFFYVNLTGTTTNAHIGNSTGYGTIQDDEPRISISDVSKAEGNRRQTTLFTFTVTLSAAYDEDVTMSYRTLDGTATSGSDYISKTGTLTFAPGETSKTITIEVKGDNKKEKNETFYLDLFGNSSNSLFTRNRGIGSILNDD